MIEVLNRTTPQEKPEYHEGDTFQDSRTGGIYIFAGGGYWLYISMMHGEAGLVNEMDKAAVPVKLHIRTSPR